MSEGGSADDERTRPEPCETCEPKLLQLAHGSEFTCEDCGQKWVHDGRGVQPAEWVE